MSQVSEVSKEKFPINIKPWERKNYPDLYSKTELKQQKLMPCSEYRYAACVVRPRKYGGDYFLYHINETVPYEKTEEQKNEERRKRKLAAERRKKKEELKRQREKTIEAVSLMKPEVCHKIVVIDFETTGFDAYEDEILQVAMIDQDGKELINELCSPVVKTSWPDAQAAHGISPDDVKNKKPFSEVAIKVAEHLLSAEVVIAYNDEFEFSFLAANGLAPDRLYWAPDPMIVFADSFNNGRWAKLEQAAAHFDYRFKSHDALEDVRATLHVFNELFR